MIARGTVLSAIAGLIAVRLPNAAVGDGIRIFASRRSLSGAAIALHERDAIVAAHGAIDGVASGDVVQSDSAALTLPLGTVLLGRAIDAAGDPLDGRERITAKRYRIAAVAPSASQRRPVTKPFWTGIRAIDALLTIGRGARVGIFGAPGCGKSTLLHMLVRSAHADAVVIGLTGERGREAEEWIRLAPRHASIVCATGDRSAAERVHAARVAVAQANALRMRGLHVLLVLDSLARFASALRECALASGEAQGRGGYPPSVFADLARLVEVPGNAATGSVTLLATVLTDGDDRDPISDAARALLDGHIALSTELAHAGRFPAIDVLASASRTMHEVADVEHQADAALVRSALSRLARSADARAFGLGPGDEETQRAASAEAAIEIFLRQGKQPVLPGETLSSLAALADTLR